MVDMKGNTPQSMEPGFFTPDIGTLLTYDHLLKWHQCL